ncbi:MAG: cupin domain-containing protein [Desulfobacula sp.]|nr:cupin domain-containing protein [Desulfobacula sp.]
MSENKSDKKKQLIKNIPFSTPTNLIDLVDYKEGSVISRTLSAKSHVNITLFAFDKGEEISAHTSPGDAMVQVLDGEAVINIDGEKITAITGQVVVMPANVPHSVSASTRFKMLLTVVKQPAGIGGL